MSKEQRARDVDEMCDNAGCSDKIRKIHYEQYVKRQWHPHPPKEFCDWWGGQYESRQGIEAKRAYNCEVFRQRYLDEKSYALPNS